jgi:hypothetical protein
MKRFILIVTGAVGSLFAILSITPPQFGTGSAMGTSTLPGAGSTASTGSGTATSPATLPSQAASASVPNGDEGGTAPVATKKATPKATKKATPKATKKATPKASTPATTPTTPAATPTTPAATTGVSGTFVGATYDAREPNGQLWGSVTVTVVLKDGKVISSTGSQSPSSRGPYAFQALDPFFKSNQMSLTQIKAESASKVVADSLYVSRVTYSSLAYWSSIKSALSKAGI